MGEFDAMSIWNLIDQFDRDGAVQETAAEAVSGDTRASFLKKAGVGAGAVAAGGAFAGALPALAGVPRSRRATSRSSTSR